MLTSTIIPWMEEQNVKSLRVLTDRGTEYCDKIESHDYQLYLAIEDIDHTKTKVRSPHKPMGSVRGSIGRYKMSFMQ